MPSEMEIFQQDLLKSVKQMRRGQAARVTRVKVPQAAEARSRVGLSQQDFARLLGVSARTLYRIRNRVVENQLAIQHARRLKENPANNRSSEDAPPRCVYSPRGAPRIKPVSTAV